MSFKKCIHCDVCANIATCDPSKCAVYRPESAFIEKVFSVGDPVYVIIDDKIVEHEISMITYSEFRKTIDFTYSAIAAAKPFMFVKEDIGEKVFLSREMAEYKLAVMKPTVETVEENEKSEDSVIEVIDTDTVEDVAVFADEAVDENIESTDEFVSDETADVEANNNTDIETKTSVSIESEDHNIDSEIDDASVQTNVASHENIIDTFIRVEPAANNIIKSDSKDIVTGDISVKNQQSDTIVNPLAVASEKHTSFKSAQEAFMSKKSSHDKQPVNIVKPRIEEEPKPVVTTSISTLAIMFGMMKRANKPYLPVKYLRKSQARLFDQIMIDPKLAAYDFNLFISDEDIVNLADKFNDILQYDERFDVIALNTDCNLNDLVIKYPIDDYIMHIVCRNK